MIPYHTHPHGRKGSNREGDHELIFQLIASNPNRSEVRKILLDRCLRPLLQFGQAVLDLSGGEWSDDALQLGALDAIRDAIDQFSTLENQDNLTAWILGFGRRHFRRMPPRAPWMALGWKLNSLIDRDRGIRSNPGDTALHPVEIGLRRLSPAERELILLRHLMGLDLRQLAGLAGQDEARLFRRLEAARRKLFGLPVNESRDPFEHDQSHRKQLQQLKQEVDRNPARIELARTGCLECEQALSHWLDACRDLEEQMRSRWCEPELGEGAVGRLLESLRGHRAGGTRSGFRLPWAELTVVAGILVALVIILSQTGVPDQAVSLPLFQPTAILGPEPVPASGGAFIDLSQTDDDSGMGFPSYPVSPQLSDDGRWLTFYYTGDEQQTGDRNSLPDLFRYDLNADKIEWVQSPSRVGSHAFTFGQSADGSVLVFSANLSSVFGFVDYGSCGDGPCSGIALHDGDTRTDEWLFIPADARQPEASSRYPYLTADGRFLAFSSNSPALAEQVEMECEYAAGDAWATYLFDREIQELEALPLCPGGVADSLLRVEVSFDGRYLLAERVAANQGTGTSGMGPHFVLYDRVTGEYLAFPSNRSEDQAEARILEAHFARGTNQVIFSSPTGGLSEGDLNSFVDLFVWDLENRTLELISVAEGGLAGNGHSGARFALGSPGLSREFAISADGRLVAFVSLATDLVPGTHADCGEFFRRPCGNIYLRDRSIGTTRLLVEEPLQEAYFTDLSIDSKGSRVAFLEQRYGCFPTGYCTNLWLHEVSSGRTDNPITGEEFARDTLNGGDIARGLAGIEYPMFSYSIPNRMISALAVSPDGSRLAAGTSGGSISLWNAYSGEALEDVSYQQLPVFQIQFTPNGNRLFAASFDGSLIAVNAMSGELEYRSYETPERFQSMALAPSGQWLVMGGGQELRLFSIRGDAIKLTLYRRFDDGPIRALAFSPDSSLLAVGTGDGTAWLLGVPEGEVRLRLAGHSGRVLQLAFSPQGDLLASAAEDRALNVWQLNSQPAGEYHPRLLLSAVHPEWVGDMAFSPDGSTLASLAFNRKVYSFRLDDLTPGAAQRVIASGVLAHLSFSPDSQQLYLTSDRNVFRIDARLDEGLFRPVDDYEAP